MNSFALATIVTRSVLDEFRCMKRSFELFHGSRHCWFIRCDRASKRVLSNYQNVICTNFTDALPNRPESDSSDFRRIVGEKMNAMADAWSYQQWQAVAFVDSDLVFTAPFMHNLVELDADVILTPNYYPCNKEHLEASSGVYNSGFVVARTPEFHTWWRHAFESQPERWTDQACLNDAPERFRIHTLSPSANVGFWRSAKLPEYEDIPADCQFLHVHLFQPLHNTRQWLDRSFALHCLKYLQKSAVPKHRTLASQILKSDRTGWYEASLRLC